MFDVINCNREQAEKLLKKYFRVPFHVTKVQKNSENEMYYIYGLTLPGLHETCWEYRPWENNMTHRTIRACFGEMYKGDRRYDLRDDYSDDLMESINKACEKAIRDYEKGCDLFDDYITCEEAEATFENTVYFFKRFFKKYYKWVIAVIVSLLSYLLLTSCVGDDSIQNYTGCEIISISCQHKDINNVPYYTVKLRKKQNVKYNIITVTCYDINNYMVGDTVKLKNFKLK